MIEQYRSKTKSPTPMLPSPSPYAALPVPLLSGYERQSGREG